MFEQRKRILLDVGGELVLIHEDEVRIGLLPEEHQQVVVREGRQLIENGLHNRVSDGRFPLGGRFQQAEQRLVFIEHEHQPLVFIVDEGSALRDRVLHEPA